MTLAVRPPRRNRPHRGSLARVRRGAAGRRTLPLTVGRVRRQVPPPAADDADAPDEGTVRP
jgi:hypothetical protein